MSEEKEKALPAASDQPPLTEPRGFTGLKYTEEFKEALLRAKGEGRALLVLLKNGEWSVDGHVYSVDEIDLKQDTVRLKIIRPIEPSEEKKKLVKSIVEKLKQTVHGSIDSAIESALLEKTDGELAMIARSKIGRLRRTRGCFWLECDETEVLL